VRNEIAAGGVTESAAALVKEPSEQATDADYAKLSVSAARPGEPSGFVCRDRI